MKEMFSRLGCSGNDGKGRARGLDHDRVDSGAVKRVAVAIAANFARGSILIDRDNDFAKINLGRGPWVPMTSL
jgi:hypothetical protein